MLFDSDTIKVLKETYGIDIERHPHESDLIYKFRLEDQFNTMSDVERDNAKNAILAYMKLDKISGSVSTNIPVFDMYEGWKVSPIP